MELTSERQVINTREKLNRLEQAYEAARNDTSQNARIRELSMRSLKRLINQFKEEIARYEAHHAVRH
jgi:hypothetical protein